MARNPSMCFVALATLATQAIALSLSTPSRTTVISCQATVAAAVESGNKQELLGKHWLDLRRNTAAHDRDVAQSPELGYTRIQSLPPASELPACTAFDVDRAATGMGSACPFAAAADGGCGSSPLPLVFQTDAPLVLADECQAIIDEARAHIESGGAGSGFTLADTNRNLAVADLPHTLAWLNTKGVMATSARLLIAC